MTRADRLLLAALVLLAVLAVPVVAVAVRGDGGVVVTGPAGITRIDTAHDGMYTVEGHMGQIVFQVRDGVVRCASSECPDQICVRAGSVRPGAPVVCAPNGVVAESVNGPGVGGLDATSR